MGVVVRCRVHDRVNCVLFGRSRRQQVPEIVLVRVFKFFSIASTTNVCVFVRLFCSRRSIQILLKWDLLCFPTRRSSDIVFCLDVLKGSRFQKLCCFVSSNSFQTHPQLMCVCSSGCFVHVEAFRSC